MAFKLFKLTPNGIVPTSYDDLDNKGFWCALGEKKEVAFVETMKALHTTYSVEIHPNKAEDRYHPDLLVRKDGIVEPMIGEVKIKNSPLFFGDKYGVSPQFALTMDLKDSFNYLRWLRNGIDITIFIWVKWEAHSMVTDFQGRTKEYNVRPMKGIWVTKFSALRQLEEKSPPQIHWYKEKFREPPIYAPGVKEEWCNELIQFEPRLKLPDGSTKNITSKGYMMPPPFKVKYPKGQSSGSYVFDLQDETVFERLVFRLVE